MHTTITTITTIYNTSTNMLRGIDSDTSVTVEYDYTQADLPAGIYVVIFTPIVLPVVVILIWFIWHVVCRKRNS